MSYPVTIKFVKTHEKAVLPIANHTDPYTGDSGYDLVAVKPTLVLARSRYDYNPVTGKCLFRDTIAEPWAVIPVGLKLAYITPGYWFRIEGRSGIGFNKHCFPHFGIIDNPYRGDLDIKMYNFGFDDVMFEAGAKVAQLIVYPLIQVNTEWTDKVEESTRGGKGLGSSDIKQVKDNT